jgi:hypothetical protein
VISGDKGGRDVERAKARRGETKTDNLHNGKRIVPLKDLPREEQNAKATNSVSHHSPVLLNSLFSLRS